MWYLPQMGDRSPAQGPRHGPDSVWSATMPATIQDQACAATEEEAVDVMTRLNEAHRSCDEGGRLMTLNPPDPMELPFTPLVSIYTTQQLELRPAFPSQAQTFTATLTMAGLRRRVRRIGTSRSSLIILCQSSGLPASQAAVDYGSKEKVCEQVRTAEEGPARVRCISVPTTIYVYLTSPQRLKIWDSARAAFALGHHHNTRFSHMGSLAKALAKPCAHGTHRRRDPDRTTSRCRHCSPAHRSSHDAASHALAPIRLELYEG